MSVVRPSHAMRLSTIGALLRPGGPMCEGLSTRVAVELPQVRSDRRPMSSERCRGQNCARQLVRIMRERALASRGAGVRPNACARTYSPIVLTRVDGWVAGWLDAATLRAVSLFKSASVVSLLTLVS